MASYYLSKIPDETWYRVKAAAAAEGQSVRAMLLAMLERVAQAAPEIVQGAWDQARSHEAAEGEAPPYVPPPVR